MSMKPTCATTHPQISEGTCPWCGVHVNAGEMVSEANACGSLELRWNIAAMNSAIEHADVEVRAMTVSNILLHGPSAEEAIPLLSKSLGDCSDRVRKLAERALVSLGTDMAEGELRRFEDQPPGLQHELAVRILLLGYYSRGKYETPSARAARQQHILWLIQYAPDSDTAGTPEASLIDAEDAECFGKAKQLWMDQIQFDPNNTTILGNAANFFLLKDHELSETLLKKARALEPSNPHWAERLGQLYSLQRMRKASSRSEQAASALRELKAAEEIRLGIPWHAEMEDGTDRSEDDLIGGLLSRIHALPELAKTAFEAGQFEEAHRFALELLDTARSEKVPEFFRDDGDAIFHGNLVLGRCALRNGDIEQAKRCLLAAGKTKGSPVLGSFGPNMSLAKELLERGEKDVVLEFFTLCGKFWKHGSINLQRWTEHVRCGDIPKFGANLVY